MSQVNVKRKKQMFILCYVPFMIALFLEVMAFKTGNIAPIVKAIKATVVVYWCCQWWQKLEKEGVRLGCIWSVMWSIDASSYGRFFLVYRDSDCGSFL